MRNHWAALVAASAIVAALGQGPATAQGTRSVACGSFYTVVRGDTLHEIAVRAYGTGNFQAIFQANRSLLPSAAIIEVGDRLLIPCLDGSGFQTRDEALAALNPGAAPAPEAQPAPPSGGETAAATPPVVPVPPADGLIRLISLRETAPLTGHRLPEGGMMTELISRAMLRSPTPVDYEIVFDDTATDPDRVVPAGFDLGFPVTRPDCARGTLLSEPERRLCTEFLYSEPVVEIETRFYVAAANELAAASDPGQLTGQTLCRPSGAFARDLAEDDLKEPNVTLAEAPRARGCFDRLADGSATVVVLSGIDLDRALADSGIAGGAAEIAAMRRSRPLHVVTPWTSENGRAFLAALNGGLAEIRASGEWTQVVDNHLSLSSASF